MPDSSVETIQFPVTNSLVNTDSVVALCNLGAVNPNGQQTSNTVLISTENLFSNSFFDLTIQTGKSFLFLGPPVVPVNSTSNGVKGTFSWTGNSTAGTLYVCVSGNTWGRANLQVGGW